MPQPKPQHGTVPEDSEAAVGSGSATGFVSMLAKRQFDADALAATPGDEAARRDRLHMAREVMPPAAAPATAPDPAAAPAAPAVPAEPGWYKAAFPAALILAVLLVGIGIWAIGALVYMHSVAPISPREVHYPLISWRLNIGNMGGYTPASRFMAWAMLLCFPVAVLLVVMARLLRQRGR
jgi:pyruvate/2-oxoglutarate dehydrogenase complex dihydrolipoamide acyltransferase (E2) component